MMVFTREHGELRKHAEKLMMWEAKVSIVVAMLIVVILIAAFIKFRDDDGNILTKANMFYGMWGFSIYLTAAIPLINSLSIIRSRFKVEDFKHLPSNKNYGMRMLLFSLASMTVACVTLLFGMDLGLCRVTSYTGSKMLSNAMQDPTAILIHSFQLVCCQS